MSNNYCNKCGITHPRGSCQTTATTTGPTSIGVELQKQIEEEAQSFSKYASTVSPHIAFRAGATAYAPYKEKYEQAAIYLEKLIGMYHSGGMPSRKFIDEINAAIQDWQNKGEM